MDFISSIFPPLPPYSLPTAHICDIREPRQHNRHLYISTAAAFITTTMPVFNGYYVPPEPQLLNAPLPKVAAPKAGLFGYVSRIFSGLKKTVTDAVSVKKIVPDLPNPEILDIKLFISGQQKKEEEFMVVDKPMWCTEPLPCDRPEMSQKSPKRTKSSPKKSPFASHHHHTKPTKNRGAKVRHELFSDIKEAAAVEFSSDNSITFEKIDAAELCTMASSVETAEPQLMKRKFNLMNENFPQLVVVSSPPKQSRKGEAFVIVDMKMIEYKPTPWVLPKTRNKDDTVVVDDDDDDDDFIVFGNSDDEAESNEDSDEEEDCIDGAHDNDDDDDDDFIKFCDSGDENCSEDEESDDIESDTEEEEDDDNETDTSDSDDDEKHERNSRQVEPQLDSGFEEDDKLCRKQVKRVAFNLTPKVVVMRVHKFAAEQARKGNWKEEYLDSERFKKRISETEEILIKNQVFDAIHRARIYANRFAVAEEIFTV